MFRTRTMSVAALAAAVAVLPACVAADQRITDPAPVAARADTVPVSLDAIARDYVRLSLEIGTHEPGYIDAYYGPPELKVEAERAPRDKATLRGAVREKRAMLVARRASITDRMVQRRADFLIAQLTAADTRLAMMMGEKLSFADEAEGLFGVRPVAKPLSSFDPVLADIARLAPGTGPLAARVDALQERFVIPKDRLKPVFDAAIAACRTATVQRIAMPAGESFTMEFVTGKPWSGYNYYKGNYHSLIQINTDLPVRLSRALDLGCHEGYPGHHLLNMLLEQRLTRARGWVEYSVYPLYSPQSVIAEGTANYGIELAFPTARRLAFERGTLFPLAGLDPRGADEHLKLFEAMQALSGARLTIAQQYLDGVITRAEAVALTQKYLLLSPQRAEQSVKFTETYRSYVLNYGLGMDMVRADIERGGADQAARWRRMEALLSEPTLPGDLR